MTDTAKAKKALILKLMRGFLSSQDRITEGVVATYLEAVDEVGVEALDRSVTQFLTGKVENRNNAFLPTAPELSTNARLWMEAIAQLEANQAISKAGRLVAYPIGTLPPPPLEPLGPTKLPIGGVEMDVSNWTLAEKDEAIRTGKVPESRKVAGVPLKLKRF